MMLRRYHEQKEDQKQGVTTLKEVTPKKEVTKEGKVSTKKRTTKG